MTHINQKLRLDGCDSLTICLKTVVLQIACHSLEYFNFVINEFPTCSAHHCTVEARIRKREKLSDANTGKSNLKYPGRSAWPKGSWC